MTSGHDDALYRMVSADQIAGSNPVAERVSANFKLYPTSYDTNTPYIS